MSPTFLFLNEHNQRFLVILPHFFLFFLLFQVLKYFKSISSEVAVVELEFLKQKNEKEKLNKKKREDSRLKCLLRHYTQ